MHILLLILAILPFIYKFSFWLYVIQLKEYRWDRFKEYLTTPQGKNALINFWSIGEIPLFFLTIMILIKASFFEGVVTYIIFYFLLIYNVFVIGKFFRKRLLKPKFTSRMIILSAFLSFGFLLATYFLVNYLQVLTYTYIMSAFILNPFIIFLCIFLLSPIVNYKKNKLINKAVLKSKEIKNPIKIGITGSYGKSSVKEYLSQILENTGAVLKTPENINTELGVSSLILKKLDNNYKYFIAEMGAYRIGEIKILGDIVNHKYGFLTAIGNQHLGLFGGIKNTKKAKFEIAKKVIENSGVLYVNGNNKNIDNFINENIDKSLKGLNYIKYGIIPLCHSELDSESIAYSDNIELKDGLTSFSFNYKDKKLSLKTNLIGKHNIVNLTGVIAFCLDLGVKETDLKKYLKNLSLPKNTLDIKKKGDITIIDDSYNLSEDGLFAGIDVLNSFSGEKILVMDDILELGKESKNIHYNIASKIAKEKLIDKVMYVGVNYKDDFINGLNDNKFGINNITTNLDNLKKDSIILFEGRKTKNYINNIK